MAADKTAEQAWESLARAHVALMRRFQADFRGAEVSMREYDVLLTLARCPYGGARLCELNDRVLLDQSSISRLVERMDGDGLVERGPDPEDRRGTRVRLTDRGRAVLRSIGPRHAAAIAESLGGALTKEELVTLRGLADKLLQGQAEG
ncbi:MarR family transcriptional regulator [Nocardiopsis sp. RSe5-2]|uniref:MarR family transcriptional regulator n=1 Tax=Nocardiopsis endophytica TaxID=3018445 RepID=A0ABT4U7C9_9ACTN|nr:MarR family transcriptional regulator [Nocardiopsis endophytica]MDA2812836.1 MarR family transcriptional regulator [Nocardiopsis endophytica]